MSNWLRLVAEERIERQFREEEGTRECTGNAPGQGVAGRGGRWTPKPPLGMILT